MNVSHSIAIGSGKGGVGKTVTAANLALYFARSGRRVALVDLDPLSDLTTLLDVQESEAVLQEDIPVEPMLSIFPNLDLFLPEKNIGTDQILARFRDDSGYELQIFDLPAGIEADHALQTIPHIQELIVVTNPEPTAHVSAGALIKKVLEINPERKIHLWHNRFTWKAGSDFNPLDVTGNYNRNVPPEDRLTVEQTDRVTDFAFVPEDPSLNLLRGRPSAAVGLLRSMLDILESVREYRLSRLPAPQGISPRVFSLIRFYLGRNFPSQPKGFLAELGEFLIQLLPPENRSRVLFAETEKSALLAFVESISRDRVAHDLSTLESQLEELLENLENSERPFFDDGLQQNKPLDRDMGALLMHIGAEARQDLIQKNFGGLLLLYFSLYKLIQSPTIVKLINQLLPLKENHRGEQMRDRHQQIKNLVEKNRVYHKQYVELIRTLFPVVLRQVSSVAGTLELSHLLFRTPEHELNKAAYVKLLHNFIHDTLYSGLSVVVGFKYRPASVAFQENAEKLHSLLLQN